MTTERPSLLSSDPVFSNLLIKLFKGVLYKQNDEKLWTCLTQQGASLKSYLSILRLEVFVDESEGYAFLKNSPMEEDELTSSRLMSRRALSYPLSLLLVELRKTLIEFDAAGSDTRCILPESELLEKISPYLPDTTNEVKQQNHLLATIQKAVEMGFLHKLNTTNSEEPSYEIRRIIKAFIDAEWLADFEVKLKLWHEVPESEIMGDQNDE